MLLKVQGPSNRIVCKLGGNNLRGDGQERKVGVGLGL